MLIKKLISIILIITFLSTTTLNGLSFAEENTETQSSSEAQEVSNASASDSSPSVAELIGDPAAGAPQTGGMMASGWEPTPPQTFTKTVSAMESFQVDPFTASGATSIPIAVPPGRKGLQPNIQLLYSSSANNGPLGVGWLLELGSIERSTKKGAANYNASDFVFNSSGSQTELVGIGGNEYRAKFEGAFMKFSFDGTSWQVVDKSGTKYYFGQDPNARQENPSGGIFKWSLDRIEDILGNYLMISYEKEEEQLYPKFIHYTGNRILSLEPTQSVEFIWKSGRTDAILSLRAGYSVTTKRLLEEIITRANEKRLSRYVFTYQPSQRTNRSLLSKVTQYGSDDSLSLPSTEFIYQSEDNPTYQYSYTTSNQGDNLWNMQWNAGDYFHSNDHTLYPSGCFSSGQCFSWSETYTQYSGSWGGGSWSTNGSGGGLSWGGPQDYQAHGWSFFYVSSDREISFSFDSDVSDTFIINPDNNWNHWHGGGGGISYTLKKGYNLIEITGYNQNNNMRYSCGSNFANQVDLMNSSQLIMPQLAGDFNADGLTDLATHFSTSGNWKVSLSTGSGFQPKTSWIDNFGKDMSPLLGDFNSDGKIDIAAFKESEGRWDIAVSNGGSFSSWGTRLSGFGTNKKPLTGDFNADGKTDVGYFDNGNWVIALGDGNANFSNQGSWLSFGSSSYTASTGDFNGDGLTDVLAFENSSGNFYVGLSNGKGFNSPQLWQSGFAANKEKDLVISDYNNDGLTDIGYFDKSSSRVVMKPCNGYNGFGSEVTWISGLSISESDAAFQVGDFDGDGLIDPLAFNPYSAKTQLGYSQGTNPDLLNHIENGIGGDMQITYVPSSIYNNSYLPFSIPVIQETQISDSFGNTYKTRYNYTGGLYDTTEREFRGFSEVVVTDAEGTNSKTYFHQDNIKKGRPYRVEVRDSGGNLYSQQETEWRYAQPYSGVEAYFVYSYKQDSYTFEGDSTFKQTRVVFGNYQDGYDSYGNPTKVISDGDVSVSGDEKTQITEYNYNTANWLLGLPKHIYLLDENNFKVSEKWFYYDDNNEDNNAQPTKGLLTQEKVWLYNPLTHNSELVTNNYTYDSYGNLKSTTDALSRTTQTNYETSFNMFPVEVKNALGQTVKSVYYAINESPEDGITGSGLMGQVKYTTDPNGVKTFNIYDSLGRLTKSIGPNDSESAPATYYEYYLTSQPLKIKKWTKWNPASTTINEDDYIITYAFFDGLGRLLQTKSPAEDDPQTAQARQVISETVTYDSRGKVKEKYLPYFTDYTDSYTTIDYTDKIKFTFYYDSVGRLIKTENLDHTAENPSYSQAIYDDWTVTSVDENLHVKKSYQDAYGRVIKIEEYEGEYPNHSLYATTNYEYDALGNLSKLTDAHGNITEIFYDSLGRKIAMQDPDMGKWQYSYDAVGNLKEQVDNKATTLRFEYDELNRLINKTSSTTQASREEEEALMGMGAGMTTASNVSYIYDSESGSQASASGGNPLTGLPANSQTYFVGRLVQVNDSVSRTKFFYDQLGREIQSEKQVSGVKYQVSRTYDALDRLTSVTYPDGYTVFYEYNKSGALEKVTGLPANPQTGEQIFVSNIDYSATGQITKIEYGNGDVRNYAYDPLTLRLTQLITHNSELITLQNLTYSFDNVGNVKAIADTINTNSQTFGYDSLNRLIYADGKSYGSINYTYDEIGNLKQKGDVTYTYAENDAGVHAVTSTSEGYKFYYDENGNMLNKIHPNGSLADFSYDAENRVLAVNKRAHDLTSAFIHLDYGWNFISFPCPINDMTTLPLEEALSSVGLERGVDYDEVLTWDPQNKKWLHNVGDSDFDEFTTWQLGQGLVVFCIKPEGKNILFSQRRLIKKKYLPLNRSYNFIGPIQGEELPVEEALYPLQRGIDYDFVLKYDPEKQDYLVNVGDSDFDQFTTLKPLDSCFIYSLKENNLWELPIKETTTTFAYDGDGGRVSKEVTSNPASTAGGQLPVTRTTYIGSLYEETENWGSETGQWSLDTGNYKKHIFLGDTRICTITNNSSLVTYNYFHGDHLGSSNLITDESGQVVQLSEYTPYGTIARETTDDGRRTNYLFTGKELDDSTGLYFYGARYYDPEIGRFITPDTIVQAPYDPQSLNRYAYARNNPILYIDPTGHGIWAIIWGIIKAIAAYAIKHPVITGMILGGMQGGINAYQQGVNIFQGIGLGALSGGLAGLGGIEMVIGTTVATAFLNTKPGQQLVNWASQEIFDDIFGMSPKAAYFWSYLVTDALISAGVSYGVHKMMNPSNAKVVKPDKLTDAQMEEYNAILKDPDAMKSSTNGRIMKDMPKKSYRALVVDNHVKAIVANDPVRFFGIPTPFQHTAIAISGGGNFDFSFSGEYLINQGVCHQGRMNALKSIGVTNLTNLDLSWQFSNWLSYGVYGTYGQNGATIDNITKASYSTYLQEKNE